MAQQFSIHQDIEILTKNYNKGGSLERLAPLCGVSKEELHQAILAYKREHETPINTAVQEANLDIPDTKPTVVEPVVLRPSCIQRALQYRDDVREGRIDVPETIQQAVKLYGDFENPAEGFYWNTKAVEKACNFIEEYCFHTKGKWKGDTIILEPWQCFVMAVAFGWMYRDSNLRQYQTIYVEVPRKNGKSTWLAAVALYLTLADDEPGSNVFCVASHMEQAKEVMNTAWTMVEMNEALRDDYDCRKMGSPSSTPHVVTNDRHTGTMEALASDKGGSLDGKNPHGVVVDELHAHPTPDTWDAIEQAIDAREQPMVWCITTAGTDMMGVCYREHDSSKKLLSGVDTDEAYAAFIWGATDEEAEDWDNEELWRRVNPNWGVSVISENYRKRANRARNIPSVLQTFKNKRLNLWGGVEGGWANMAYWLERKADWKDANGEPWKPPRGCKVYVGFDLSEYLDLSAVSIMYEMPFGIGVYHTIKCYIPKTTYDNANNVLYKKWEASGDLIVTPGNVTSFHTIRQDILNLRDKDGHYIYQVTYDGHQALQLASELDDEGIEVVQFTQNPQSYNPVMRYFEKLLAGEEGQIWHDGNPAMTWMLSNVKARENRKRKLMPDKPEENHKIDGAVAMLMNLTPLAIKDDSYVEGPLVLS